MPASRHGFVVSSSFVALAACALAQAPDTPPPPPGVLPRYMTPAEQRIWDANPPVVERGPGATPLGDIRCVAEYEPMEGIVISWEGGALTTLLAQMAARITNEGDANL